MHIKGQNYFYNKNQNLFDVMFVCGNMNLIDFTVIKVINYIQHYIFTTLYLNSSLVVHMFPILYVLLKKEKIILL